MAGLFVNADTSVDFLSFGALFGFGRIGVVLSYLLRGSNFVGLGGFEPDSVDELVEGLSDGGI